MCNTTNLSLFCLILLTLAPAAIQAAAQPQPLVKTFAAEDTQVLTHLASILETAMTMALQHQDISQLSNDGPSKKIIMTQAMTSFLNFDVTQLNQEYVDTDQQNFIKRVIDLFDKTCVATFSVEMINQEDELDLTEVEVELRSIMSGYYFANLKAVEFDSTNLKIDWKFEDIQKGLQVPLSRRMNEIMQTVQQKLAARYTKFLGLFQTNYNHLIVIFRSFRSFAKSMLLDQLRTYYFNLAENPQTQDQNNAKRDFQRTVDIFMIIRKLCVKECTEEQRINLVPNFLEELVQTRIDSNDKIVSSPVAKTLFSKFLGFLLQLNFQNNYDSETINKNGEKVLKYSMFIYRFFLSKGSRYMNKKLSSFLQVVYQQNGLNFLHPKEELKNTDMELFTVQQMQNRQVVFDLILHLDFPEIDQNAEQDMDTERTQFISFTNDDVDLLVQIADTIFSHDLREVNSESLILNWFTGFNQETNYQDFLLTYQELVAFRYNYKGDQPGQDFDQYIDTHYATEVDALTKENAQYEPKASLYMVLKVTNMINVLSGKEYNVVFSKTIKQDTQDDLILYFRRIVSREEFNYLHKSMLLIFNYYKGKTLSTDVEDDKFLTDTYDMEIECIKLPEILSSSVTITSIVLKDDDISPIRKDNGLSSSQTNVESISLSSSNNSSYVTDKQSPSQSNKTQEESPVNKSTHSGMLPINVINTSNQTRSNETVSPSIKTVIITPIKSETSSPSVKSRTSEINRERTPNISQNTPSAKSLISKDKTPSKKTQKASNETSSLVISEITSNSNSQLDQESVSHNQSNNSTPKNRVSIVESSVISIHEYSSPKNQTNQTKSIPQIHDKTPTHRSSFIDLDQDELTSSQKTRKSNVIKSTQTGELSNSQNNSPSQSNHTSKILKDIEETSNHSSTVRTQIIENVSRKTSRKTSQTTSNKTHQSSAIRSHSVKSSPIVTKQSTPQVSQNQSSQNTSVVSISVKSSPKNIDIKSQASNQVRTPSNKTGTISNKTETKSNKTHQSSQVQSISLNTHSHSNSQKNIVDLNSPERNRSSVESISVKSSHKNIDIISQNSNQVRTPSNKTSIKTKTLESSHIQTISVNTASNNTNQHTKTPSNKTKSNVTPEIIIIHKSSSNKTSNNSSSSSNSSSHSHNKSDIHTHTHSSNSSSSSNSSHSKSKKSNQSGQLPIIINIDNESRSNKTPVDSSITTETQSPMIANISTHSQSNVIEEIQPTKKNLVYEVAGKLSSTQMHSFEYSEDIFTDIKNMRVEVDEFGNEIEYVYVQIVRKNSDCYEELGKFM